MQTIGYCVINLGKPKQPTRTLKFAMISLHYVEGQNSVHSAWVKLIDCVLSARFLALLAHIVILNTACNVKRGLWKQTCDPLSENFPQAATVGASTIDMCAIDSKINPCN